MLGHGSKLNYFWCKETTHAQEGPAIIVVLLSLGIIFCASSLSGLSLFLLSSLLIFSFLLSSSVLLSLLSLLVYIGALIILFAYLWIYIPNMLAVSSFPVLLLPFILISCFNRPSLPTSLTPLIYSSSLYLFLVCILFWAMVVVVLVLDLGLGGFSS